jgi:hypothetical protein
MNITNIAYVAGLFDGEGSITYKKYKERKKKGNKVNYYNCWRIAMEVSMTDKNAVEFIHETLGCGTLRPKPRKEHKMQYRWRCTFRDALYVCKVLWPYAITKLHKIEQIIDHYEPHIQELGDNVVDLEVERQLRSNKTF